MLYFNPGAKAQAKRVLLLYGISKTLPYKGPSNRIISLGNIIYILVYGVPKDALIKRGYFLNRQKNYKREGN